MKSFHFQQFTLQQSEKVFAVGTDGVLLGSLCCVENAEKVLEVGAGTGLISLMIAQRNLQSNILALDINADSVKLASLNFQNSPFQDRLQVKHCDFNNFETRDKFDLIVSNPPYFGENSSLKHITARQQTQLTFQTLIRRSAEFLKKTGTFSVIIPFEAEEEFEEKCRETGLFPVRKIKIFGLKNSVPKRWILEFQFSEKPCEISEFTIEESPRKYSVEYLKLTKDFHVFKNNQPKII